MWVRCRITSPILLTVTKQALASNCKPPQIRGLNFIKFFVTKQCSAK